jgi:RNAse (barnase) inhibitor barstar
MGMTHSGDMIEFHAPGSSPSDEGRCVVRIPLAIIQKQDLLGCIATKLKFPDYFGYNWDALDECLADLSWLQTREVCIWHDDIPLSNQPNEARCYLRVLQAVLREPGRVQVRISFPKTTKAELDVLLV